MATPLKDRLLNVFLRWDSAKSGTISRETMASVLRDLTKSNGTNPKEDEIEKLLDAMDPCGSGVMDYQDFCCFLLGHVHSPLIEPSPKFMELVQKLGSHQSGQASHLTEELVQEHQAALTKLSRLNDALRCELKDFREKKVKASDGDASPKERNRPHMLTSDRSLAERLAKAEGTMSHSRSLRRKKTGWDDEVKGPVWQLAKEDRDRKGGPKHVQLEEQADNLRAKNDVIGQKAFEIKKTLKKTEAELISLLEELHPIIAVCSPESDALQVKIAEHVKSMETADFELAALRREELRNIEAIRCLKIRMWRLLQDDRVESMIEDVEMTMRSGKGSWYGSRKHTQLQALQDEMKTLNNSLGQEARSLLQQAIDSTARISEADVQLAKAMSSKDDQWAIVSEFEAVFTAASKTTFDLQVMSWGLTHILAKKLSVLRKVYKLCSAEKFLQRQWAIENVLSSSDVVKSRAELERLQSRAIGINGQTKLTKETITRLMEEADALREQLRGMRHVQNNEASNKRDQMLMFIDEVVREDTQLAWLRKDQLQSMELSGLLRKQLPNGPWHETLPLVQS